MSKKKAKAKTLQVVRTFGWEGLKYRPGMRFPADHEKTAEFVEIGYLKPSKGWKPNG